ncbi:hypothetical protein [Nitriliruptor alkaliphilus]|uniref:hypothetical protein n=1 Tax=Nitriliruptor alkaliphilus TaxID=427918 RepID=UPI0006977E38|nr:hypothetical protein [Nitriliruptor alkaliphilus]
MRTPTRVLVVLPLVLALAGCGGSGSDPDPESATTADAEDAPAEDPVEAGDDGSSEAAAGDLDCPDGPRDVRGMSVVTFSCGSATASVTTSGGTWSLTGGSCEAAEDTFAVNFGTVLLGTGDSPETQADLEYVGIAIHEDAGGDGSYDDHDMVTVFASVGGEEYALGTSTVTLRDGRTAGEASSDGVEIEFDCG